MPTIEINGVKVYYELAGAGQTVVLLHAGITDVRMWDATFAALATEYRVLRYDLRGFGQTTAPPMAYSHHEDLRALLDALGIERAAVIGSSNGGRVSLNFTLTYPQRVTALGMICSSPEGFDFKGDTPTFWEESDAAYRAGDLERAAELEAKTWYVGLNRTTDQVDPEKLAFVREMDLIALQKYQAGIGEEQRLTPPAAERLSEVGVPTLVVIGEEDTPPERAAGEFMATEIARARQIAMPNTAHLPSMERPDEFNQIVRTFLQSALSV